MTTTAYDDQFSAEPEPVHQPYDVAEILRQNIADLEKELKRQKERAENAEAKLAGSREDLQCWIESRNGWMDRAHAAEMELKAAREQERELCAQLCEWLPVSTGWEGRTFAEAIRGIGLGGELSNGFAPFNPIPAPVVPAPEIPDGDAFNGTTLHLIQCIESLVRMNDRGVLVPHGIGGHARTLLLASANRLRQQPAPVVPEEWRNIVTEMVGWWDDKHMTMSQGRAIRDKASALLQSAGGGK